MPRKLSTAQKIGMMLKLAGRGLGTYADIKESQRERGLEAEDRAFTDEQREVWRETQRQAQAEINQRRQAEAFIRVLGGQSPFAPDRPGAMPEIAAAIPDPQTRRQRAYDVAGRPAPVDVKLGAFGEGLGRAGYKPEQIAMAKLRELGILPSPTERRNVMTNEALLRLPQGERDEILLGTKPGRPALTERDRSRYLQLWEQNRQKPLKGRDLLEFKIFRNKFEPTSDLDSKLNQWEKLLSKPQADWTARDRLKFNVLRGDLFNQERTVDPAIIRKRVTDLVKARFDLKWNLMSPEEQIQEVDKIGRLLYRDQWPELDGSSTIYGEDPVFDTYQSVVDYVYEHGEHAAILYDPRIQRTSFPPIKLSELLGGGRQSVIPEEDADMLKEEYR